MASALRALTAAVLGTGTVAIASPQLASAAMCVGGSGCYPRVQAAIDAGRDGDTITIAPGTFAGPITVAKSIRIVSAGPGRTSIRGGGPVVIWGDQDQPPSRASRYRG